MDKSLRKVLLTHTFYISGIGFEQLYERAADGPLPIHEKIVSAGTFGAVTAGILALTIDIATHRQKNPKE